MRRFTVLSLAFSSVLFACATSEEIHVKQSDTSATTPTTDAASFCSALCERQASCDTSLDQQTCANACKNQNAAVFPRLRADVVEGIVSCVNEEDCKTVLGSGLVGTCASEAVAKVAPSATAIAFCDAMASTQQKCGGSSSKAQCLETAKLYSDEAIGEAQNCAGRKCTDVAACVSAVFGSFGSSTTTTTAPTASCGSLSSAFGPACSACAQQSCCTEAQACSKDSGCMAIVNTCAAGSSASSSCSAALSSYPSSSASLASSFFACGQSSCSSSCQSSQL